MSELWKQALAEFIGTFIFVSVILNVTSAKSIYGVIAPLAIGLTLAICIFFCVPTSKGSMNPAVSIALYFKKGGLVASEVAVYIVVEILAALLAVAWFKYILNG